MRSRSDVRDFAVARLGSDEAVLILDETGDLKKGEHTVGVQRQYTGTAGRVENAQVSVWLAYATSLGHALVDVEVYLPRSWTDDLDRMEAAGVPEGVEFATKPALAQVMLARAFAAGVDPGWVTADEVYGQDPRLRGMLEDHRTGYVLAVSCHHRFDTGQGLPRPARGLVAALPESAWQPHSAGLGAKGDRFYDYAWIDLPDHAGGHASLLARRNRSTGELAFYRCWSPRPVTLAALVRIAGRRWAIEESFQQAKGRSDCS